MRINDDDFGIVRRVPPATDYTPMYFKDTKDEQAFLSHVREIERFQVFNFLALKDRVRALSKRLGRRYSMYLLSNAFAQALGYSNWSQMQHFNLTRPPFDIAVRKVVHNPIEHYFRTDTRYVDAALELLATYSDGLLERASSHERLDFVQYRQSFGFFYKAFARLPVVWHSDCDREQLKVIVRAMYLWHFRDLIDTRLVVKQVKTIPKRFRIEKLDPLAKTRQSRTLS